MFQSIQAWRVIDWVAVPGPPPSRMLGMSMILKPSMRRMRTIVVDTGSRAGIVMCTKVCQRFAPSTSAASWTSWSRPSIAASRTMNTNGVHCHVSPMITAIRASHGSVTQVKFRSPSWTHRGSSGPFEVSVIIRNM